MTKPVQGLILFCDDLRDEVGGKSTIVGMMSPRIEIRGAGLDIPMRCIVLLIAEKSTLKITGRIHVHGVPDSYKQPNELDTTIEVEDDGNALVQIAANLKMIPITSGKVTVSAEVTVNDQLFSNSIEVIYISAKKPRKVSSKSKLKLPSKK